MNHAVAIGQHVRTVEDHPFPFEGEVVGITLTVRDQDGALRQVDSMFAVEEIEPNRK